MAVFAEQGDGLALLGVCNGRVFSIINTIPDISPEDAQAWKQIKETSMTAEMSAIIAALAWTLSLSDKNIPVSIHSDSKVAIGLADASFVGLGIGSHCGSLYRVWILGTGSKPTRWCPVTAHCSLPWARFRNHTLAALPR